jgi:hypothetical protein
VDAALERVEVPAKEPIKANAIIVPHGCIHPFERPNDVLFISAQENSHSDFGATIPNWGPLGPVHRDELLGAAMLSILFPWSSSWLANEC